MNQEYVGVIKSPDAWWMSRSKVVYDAWDWPDGPERDAILSEATRRGVLVRLGPSSMDTAHAAAAARRVFGEEVLAKEALEGFVPHTQRGRDFLNNTGEFAPDKKGEQP